MVTMLVRGATPSRAVVAGQGLRQVLGFGGGTASLLRRVFGGSETFEPGSPEERTARWFRSSGVDPVAVLHVLDSLPGTPEEDLGRIRVPTLVAMGSEDERADSAEQLVAALPHGTLATVPADHSTAVAAPEFVTAVLDLLAGGR
ncbi:alpha/beta fold hydrolase [Streptomyces sp. TS71-3]|uniref:alpha/beta fold hydrolase n=1 Tax=Streptomyces sp. TS71-3 TaxID=2733862 RepID=UPI001B1A039C|nr:hypothetical protein [Streptomyces sp. TS71-3]GHJ41627.1 hypothetical protein Sm713_72360 [Streptomyces sp. TS71-3]